MSNRAAAIFLLMFVHACDEADDEALDGGSPPTSWCEGCTLAMKLEPLRKNATDCGSITMIPDWLDEDAGVDSVAEAEAVLGCVRDALEEGSRFVVVLNRAGIDSIVQSAWAGTQDGVYVLSYDSDICGGAGTNCTETCGPRFSRSVCEDPRVSTADVVIECGPDGEEVERCEPPGRDDLEGRRTAFYSQRAQPLGCAAL